MADLRERVAGYLGAVVGLTLVCGLLMAMVVATQSDPLLGSHEPIDEPQSNLLEANSRFQPLPEAHRGSSAPETVRVFECVRDGVRAFSDQSCGDEAQVKDVSVSLVGTVSRPRVPAEIIAPAASPAQPATSRRRNDTRRSANLAECQSLQEAKENIDKRMRAGFTSSEGEWLRRRWHELDDRYRDLHCLRG